MTLYKFLETPGMRVALSEDPRGQNLPQTKGNWDFAGSVELRKGGKGTIGASADDIIDGIERMGVFIRPMRLRMV